MGLHLIVMAHIAAGGGNGPEGAPDRRGVIAGRTVGKQVAEVVVWIDAMPGELGVLTAVRAAGDVGARRTGASIATGGLT